MRAVGSNAFGGRLKGVGVSVGAALSLQLPTALAALLRK